MSFLLPLIFILLTNLTNVVLFKRSFGKVIILSFVIPTLITYLTGIIFDNFLPGYIISLIYSLIGLIYLVYKLIKKQSLKDIKDKYFDLGFILFIIVYILVYVMNIGRYFSNWDEFGYWGYTVKLMIANNKIFLNTDLFEASAMVAHPPFVSIWEYLYCKIAGGYSESILSNSIQLIEFLFLIPFASYLDVKDKKINVIVKSILSVFTVMLAIYQLDIAKTATNTYTDVYMMLYYAYCFGLVIFMSDFKDKKDWIIFVFASAGFLLNKQIVLPLYLVIVFYIILKKLIDKNKEEKFIKSIIPIIGIIIIPLLMYKTWGLFIGYKYANVKDTGTSVSMLTNVVNFVKGTNREVPRKIISQYITIITEQHIFQSPIINLGFFSMVMIGLVVLIIIYKRHKEKFEGSKFVAMFWSIVVASLGYAFTFLVLYAFGGFSVDEGMRCASYARYFSTFILAMYAIIFIEYLNIRTKEKNIKIEYKTIVIIMAIVVTLSSNIKILNFIPAKVRAHNGVQNFTKYINNANIIKNTLPENSKILVISEDISDPTYTRYYIPEYVIETQWSCQSIFESQKDYYEKFYNTLMKSDYLYVSDNYEFFEDNFGHLFVDSIEDGKIYEIVKDNKNIVLKMKN